MRPAKWSIGALLTIGLAVATASACSRVERSPLPGSIAEPPTGARQDSPSIAEPGANATSASGRQNVSAAGGTINFRGVRLEIPPGALASPVNVEIRVTPRSVADEGRAFNLQSDVYTFEPHGLRFAKPITVTFDAAGAAPESVILWSTENPANGFEPLPLEVGSQGFRGQVTHFSEGYLALLSSDPINNIAVGLAWWCDVAGRGRAGQPCCFGACGALAICDNGTCDEVACKTISDCPEPSELNLKCEFDDRACALTGKQPFKRWPQECRGYTCVEADQPTLDYRTDACLRGAADLPPWCCKGAGAMQCPNECCNSPRAPECANNNAAVITYASSATCTMDGRCDYDVASVRDCPLGTTCTNGACQCPAGLSMCGGQCVDTTSNRAHCGACDKACGGLSSNLCPNTGCGYPHKCTSGVCTPQAYFWALYTNGDLDSPPRQVTVVLDGQTFGPWGSNVGFYTPLGVGNPPITVGDHIVTISVDGPTNRTFWFTPTVWGPGYYRATSGFELLDASGAAIANFPVSFAGITSKTFIARVR